MIINSTPVRTSKNFGMNDIEVENLNLEKKTTEFNNIKITGDIEKFNISDDVSLENLTYGNGIELENEVLKNANTKIKIEENKSGGNLILEFNLDDNNSKLVENIEINAISKLKTTIFIKYISSSKKEGYHNGIIRVNAKPESNTNIVILNMVNNKTKNFLSIDNNVQESSNLNYTIIDFGGIISVTNYYSNLIGDNAKNNLNTIYLGTQEQKFDINYIDELRGEKTIANIEVQGALKDNATKNFKGTIDFKKGCKKAKGDENEFCMLLSDTAKSKALPMLLCTEEDVEGSHSTAAGKAEDDLLFYIMSRGISEKEAKKLIVKAKFNKIIESIKDEELKQNILNEIDKRLD